MTSFLGMMGHQPVFNGSIQSDGFEKTDGDTTFSEDKKILLNAAYEKLKTLQFFTFFFKFRQRVS